MALNETSVVAKPIRVETDGSEVPINFPEGLHCRECGDSSVQIKSDWIDIQTIYRAIENGTGVKLDWFEMEKGEFYCNECCTTVSYIVCEDGTEY